jgi:hypothetical protein
MRSDVGGTRYRATVEFGPPASAATSTRRNSANTRTCRAGRIRTIRRDDRAAEERVSLRRVHGGATRDDQFYAIDTGKYNTWRVRSDFSETPHVFTSTYDSLWTGVGTNTLKLTGLTPGGTTNANTTQATMQSAIASTTEGDLYLTRQKSRTRFDLMLPDN